MDEITILKNQAKKYLDTADEKTIRMVYAMLEVDSEKDWWDDLPAEAKKSIERGLDDIKKGKVTLHEDVMKKYRKWLS
jgi:predicted transcriptional regulator